jgi:hypothetical protein
MECAQLTAPGLFGSLAWNPSPSLPTCLHHLTSFSGLTCQQNEEQGLTLHLHLVKHHTMKT